MPVIAPPAITALPAAPDPNDRATFNARAYPWAAAQAVLATEVAAVAANVAGNATDAEASATAATTQAGLADADATATAADRIQTGLDRTQTGLDRDAAAASAATIGSTAAFADTNPVVKGSADATKQIRFEVDGLTTGTTRVLTVPNEDLTLAGRGANTFTAAQEWPTGAPIASAATINLDTATGNRVHITGTAPITAVTLTRGPRTVIFDGILPLTHHATDNNLPGAANITTAAGDRAIYESDGTTVYCISYIRKDGTAVVGTSPSGVAKAWLACNSGGSILASFGVASIVDVGVGQLRVNLTTPFSSANYVINATGSKTFGSDGCFCFVDTGTAAPTASSFYVGCKTGVNGVDPVAYYISCFGD